MSEMVERVAEALFMARFRNEPHFNYQDSFEKDEYRLQACAAIEALREPTVDQLEACGNHGVGRIIWRQMIDEALK